MGEDDALYDSNGKIIRGKEDLIKRLLDLYKMFDEYNANENIGNKFTSALEDKGVSEDVANKIKSQLPVDEIKKATELDILPYIDENATVESVREAIKKAQEEADKNPVDGTVTFTKDPPSLLTESDDKSKTVNLADLENIYNDDKRSQMYKVSTPPHLCVAHVAKRTKIHSFSSASFTVSILSLTSWSSEIVSPAFTLLHCNIPSICTFIPPIYLNYDFHMYSR